MLPIYLLEDSRLLVCKAALSQVVSSPKKDDTSCAVLQIFYGLISNPNLRNTQDYHGYIHEIPELQGNFEGHYELLHDSDLKVHDLFLTHPITSQSLLLVA